MNQPVRSETPSGRTTPDDQAARLDYIYAMLGQLRSMAEAEKCDVLAYLIDMARVEIRDVLRRRVADRPRSRRNARPG